jgi:hypothetical protein
LLVAVCEPADATVVWVTKNRHDIADPKGFVVAEKGEGVVTRGQKN